MPLVINTVMIQRREQTGPFQVKVGESNQPVGSLSGVAVLSSPLLTGVLFCFLIRISHLPI